MGIAKYVRIGIVALASCRAGQVAEEATLDDRSHILRITESYHETGGQHIERQTYFFGHGGGNFQCLWENGRLFINVDHSARENSFNQLELTCNQYKGLADELLGN